MNAVRPTMPIALAIAVSPRFVLDHEHAFTTAGVVPMHASIGEATSMALQWRPAVIVLTEDVYAFDPPRFDALAQIVGATIAWIGSEEATSDVVQKTVARALVESRTARRAHDEHPTIPMPGHLPPDSEEERLLQMGQPPRAPISQVIPCAAAAKPTVLMAVARLR